MFPTLYTIPYLNFTITTLGAFSVLAFLVGIWVFTRLSFRRQLDLQFMADHFWFFIFCTVLGARLQSVMENWTVFADSWGLIFYGVWVGGLRLFGGIIGFMIGLFYQCYRHKEIFLRWMDIVSVAMMPLLGISYVGMFCDGGGYGYPTSLPWGVSFENIAVPFTIPIHPTQLYLAILALVCFLLGKKLLIQKKTHGFPAFATLTIFAVGYFCIDFLRGDNALVINGLRLSQYLSIFTIVMLVIALFYQKLNNKNG